MAEGIGKAIGKGGFYSAGSKPSGIVNPSAIEVMKEIGIDISSHKSKGFNDLSHKEFDYVITMGCSDVCPFYPAKQKLDWKIEDPKGRPIEFFRKTRDQIKQALDKIL
ncbi:MAG: arsenate reductase ArsC [Candidatus Saganbacteria bacterium]|nr:arsenate reductase ArsC [Candidatus Saganbacteria bacterium]